MNSRTSETPPVVYARVAGCLYLVIIIAGIFAEFLVRSKLVVQGDAAATASNILASETLFRLGLAGDLIMTICDVGVALLVYILLKPVHSGIALIATSFRLIQAAILAINSLNHVAVLSFLSGAEYLKAFAINQLHAMVMLALKAHTFGYLISGVFFGVHCFLLGYLLYKSVYFPRVLGILLAIASLSYLTDSFTSVLSPEMAAIVSQFIIVPAVVAELSLCLWLLIWGVKLQRTR